MREGETPKKICFFRAPAHSVTHLVAGRRDIFLMKNSLISRFALRYTLQKQIFFGLLLSVIFCPLATSAEVNKLVFATLSQTIKPEAVSEKITISAQDESGNPAAVPQTTCLSLKSSPGVGEFSSSNTNWSPVEKLTMSSGSANRSFYYKNLIAGNYTITVKAALRPVAVTEACSSWPIEEWGVGWVVSQNIVVSDSAEAVTEPVVAPAVSGGQASSATIDPRVYAYAGPDKTALIGKEEWFAGQAFNFNKQEVENVRYSWSFGDGARSYGKTVSHVYKYPGEYVVFLEVAHDKYIATSRLTVKAVYNQLKISEANSDFISITNQSGLEVDVSGWYLRFNGSMFKFPSTTIVRPASSLVIPSITSGLKVSSPDEFVELLYPSELLAFAYTGKAETATATEKIKSVAVSAGSLTIGKNRGVISVAPAEPESPLAVVGNNQNPAAVVYASQGGGGETDNWLWLTAGAGLLAASGYVYSKKQKPAESPALLGRGEEFSLEEDKF